MGVMVFGLVVGLLVVGLEWNRRRQPYPRETRVGRIGGQDRDFERVRAEVWAASDRETVGPDWPRLVNKGHAAD